MFKSYASKITSFLIENKEINQDDYEVYKYGFEVLIAFIVNIINDINGFTLISNVFFSILIDNKFTPISSFVLK